MVISKIVGAVFKIPLTNILGGIGMGYYSTAYSLYTPVFAMTAAAVPTVIIKAVADNIALRRFANAQKVLRTAGVIFGGTGLIRAASLRQDWHLHDRFRIRSHNLRRAYGE